MAENEEDYLRRIFALFPAAYYKKVWEWPIQRRRILFFELLHGMEQGIADTAISRQGTEE